MNNFRAPKKASQTHEVGGGFSVTFSMLGTAGGATHISCVWSPRQPTLQEMQSSVDASKYEDAMMQFVVRAAFSKGGVHG